MKMPNFKNADEAAQHDFGRWLGKLVRSGDEDKCDAARIIMTCMGLNADKLTEAIKADSDEPDSNPNKFMR